ncbi:TULIP family P47-like protein [Serratia marcescens]|uniref:TULIP family P47-like protein n=1 Tax=Serratia marcescens TaxID=615 RepID=UPI0022384933|nr:TULIP family P47-like protein [Serratia marcescens]
MSDASTTGWDVVSVTDLDTMNAIINDDKLYPKVFSASDIVLGTKIDLVGEWGQWEISENASGGKINLRCEIISGSVKYRNMEININDGNNTSYVEIEVLLKGILTSPEQWISGDDKITGDTRCHKLMIDADNTVIVTEHNFTGPDMSKDGLSSVVPDLFQEWFNENVGKFGQIFSVILMGLETRNTDFQWLYPSAYSYAANSSIDGRTTGFGVLTLIDGKTDTSKLQQSIDIQALNLVKTFGANLALVVSKSMFVKHILLPAAVSIVKGSTESDFTISDTGLSLTNNREMVWQNFDDGKGHTVSPTIPKENFILTLQSDYIHLSIVGAHYRPQAGVTVYMNVEQNFRYKVEKNDDGEPVFVPDEKGMGDALISCFCKFDSWLGALELAMGIISSIAGVIALGTGFVGAIATGAVETMAIEEEELVINFTFNIGRFEITTNALADLAVTIQDGVISNPTIFNVVKIASIVTAATTGIAFGSIMIAEAVYKGIYKDVPSFHSIANAITGGAVWPNIKNTELKSASLADSFVIGLELK